MLNCFQIIHHVISSHMLMRNRNGRVERVTISQICFSPDSLGNNPFHQLLKEKQADFLTCLSDVIIVPLLIIHLKNCTHIQMSQYGRYKHDGHGTDYVSICCGHNVIVLNNLAEIQTTLFWPFLFSSGLKLLFVVIMW